MTTMEGEIEIDLVDFWAWMVKHHAPQLEGMETSYGVPRIEKGSGVMVITFAASSDGSPADWAEKPMWTGKWLDKEGVYYYGRSRSGKLLGGPVRSQKKPYSTPLRSVWPISILAGVVALIVFSLYLYAILSR